jgi:hypothetical protein
MSKSEHKKDKCTQTNIELEDKITIELPQNTDSRIQKAHVLAMVAEWMKKVDENQDMENKNNVYRK